MWWSNHHDAIARLDGYSGAFVPGGYWLLALWAGVTNISTFSGWIIGAEVVTIEDSEACGALTLARLLADPLVGDVASASAEEWRRALRAVLLCHLDRRFGLDLDGLAADGDEGDEE